MEIRFSIPYKPEKRPVKTTLAIRAHSATVTALLLLLQLPSVAVPYVRTRPILPGPAAPSGQPRGRLSGLSWAGRT
jgi:hypothetical protein